MPDSRDLPLVFSRADAADHGIGRARLDRWLARDEAQAVGPGLYAESVRWFLTPRHERHLALARAAQPRFSSAVLSHVSAVLDWGLPAPRWIADQPHLTVDTGVRTSDDSSWCRVLRCALPERRVVRGDGRPRTDLARTAVDAFRSLPLPDALAVADAVVARGVTPGELVAVRKEQARWPGVSRARRGIGLVDGRRESWLESASVGVLAGWLPIPASQVEVYDLGELLGRADLLWPDLRVVGEADGRGKYRGDHGGGRSEAAVSERLIAADERARRLVEAGLGVVRWGSGALRHPQTLAARIRAAVPDGRLRAVLVCAACRQEVDQCRCAPRLRLSDR